MIGDAYQLRTKIDELKYKETYKISAKYQLLNVVENIKTSASKSEFSYLRKFEDLMEIILDDTRFILSDGDSISAATKDTISSMVDNEQKFTEYGGRIDLLEDATTSVFVQQQSKNARINSYTLSYINSLTNNSDNQVFAFDFKGNSGYLTQMYCYKNIMYSQKVTELHIPTDILEFDCLEDTLKYLYMWKLHLITLSAKVLESLFSNKRKYSFVETCGEDIVNPLSRSPSPTPLNQVFMSSHRKSKK
ncbi:hypothetical protein BD770DRAFT_415482 [Pilaira anomala]|nr:hypothetical protein BD770DRAFT_415482 [Pilaira anomala]